MLLQEQEAAPAAYSAEQGAQRWVAVCGNCSLATHPAAHMQLSLSKPGQAELPTLLPTLQSMAAAGWLALQALLSVSCGTSHTACVKTCRCYQVTCGAVGVLQCACIHVQVPLGLATKVSNSQQDKRRL